MKKHKYKIEIRNGDIYFWRVLDEKDIKKKVNEAIKRYVKRTGNKPEILRGHFKLPKIHYKGKVIDLDEKYKGAKIITEFIGVVPYIPYIDLKDGKKVKFIHFPENDIYLVADVSDRERIYLIHSLKLTQEGLKG